MIVENLITYTKIMCKGSKLTNGIKLIYKEIKEESISIYEFKKDENIKLFVDFSKSIIKLVKRDFINGNKSINNMNERNKILDLVIEYIEKVGFIFDISFRKNIIWTISEIDNFIKDNIKIYILYEIYVILSRESLNPSGRNDLNEDIINLRLDYFYDYEIEDLIVHSQFKMNEDLYNILIDYIYNIIEDKDLNVNVKISSLLSNNFYVRANFINLYDLLLYVLLENYISFNHHKNYKDIEDKIYYCEGCGEEYVISKYDYDTPPNHMKYCEDCRDKLQKNYKNEYKEKVKIIDELRQYKGKIPKEYNDLRNEYNKFMRLINNRKKGDKLPTLNELGKMLLKFKNIK